MFRVGLVADDDTSRSFELPVPARVLGKYAARAFLARTDRDFDYFIDAVKSTGDTTCYIDTGFCPVGGSTVVVVDCLMNSTKGQQSLFACNDGATDSFSFGAYINGSASSGGKWAFHCNDGSGSWNMASGLTVSSSERVVVVLDSALSPPKGSVTVASTGETYAKSGTAGHENVSKVPLYLAQRNTSGSKTPAAVTFYSCVITNAGVCVRDFRPAVKFGVAGMWDAVNNRFYASAGSTALIAAGTNLTYAVLDGDAVVASSSAYETMNADFRTDVPYVDSNSVTISGGGSKGGAAPLTLAGKNTWGGAFTVNEGTLVADFGQGLAATDGVVLNGGTYCPHLSNLYTGTLGASAGAGLVSVAPGSVTAGFSAYGHPRTVRLGDDAASTLLTTGAEYRISRLILNDSYATDTLIIDNGIDFGTETATNVVGAAVAVVKGNVRSGGTLRREGAGTLILNGATNSFGALTLVKGSKTVIAPPVDGVDNRLAMTGFSTSFTHADELSLVVSNMNTTMSSGSGHIAVAGGRHEYVGGKFTVSPPTGKYFRPGYYSKSTSPLVTGGTELIFNSAEAKLNGLTMAGTKSTYVDTRAEIVITNDATVTTGYNFWLNNGSVRQYSGRVKITNNGNPMLAVSYNSNATCKYHLHGGVLEQSYDAPANAVVIGGGATSGNTFNEEGYVYIHEGAEAIFNAKNVHLGYRVTDNKYHRGYLYVCGGRLTMSYNGARLSVGRQGNGTFEVSDGGVATINGSVAALTDSAGGRTAAVNILTNGTLKARCIESFANAKGENDTASLVLDGGTVIANTSAATSFIGGFTAAVIGIGGATVDTAGQNLTIAQSFAAREGQSATVSATADGLAAIPAFTKIGAGTLTLAGDNDYLCATCVSDGTLKAGANALPSATTLQLRGGVVDLDGNSVTVANLIGSGTVSNGTLTVTGTVWPGVIGSGTLKIDATAALNMTTLGCRIASGGACGCLEVAGTQNLSGVTIVGEGMENRPKRGVKIVRASAISGVPAGDASLSEGRISVRGGTLRVGEPGLTVHIR
ncbi:MAG: autotransporter-associated beta strand repeat-containing protein [Kiritimatiellae bacterium]|nr:autotransporter-associated beta strand repeat-containing protein [Kiritimatiellia bacterium]